MFTLSLLLLFSYYDLALSANVTQTCRCIPTDDCWPVTAEWNQLNETVEGRLIGLTPGTMLGAVCHDPQFNETACEIAKEEWATVQFHFVNPTSFMMPYFQNHSCDPFTAREQRCVLGNYADYSINVTGPVDIAAGLQFANEKNIRVVIKNTGHDYLGKSTGRGSLSLWTHNLKNVSLLSFSSSSYTGPAIKLGAGIQAFEAYAFANANGLRVLGGECPTVGLAGGWTTGAGHSALSSIYGMGADQTLSWEVVLANGSLVEANQTHNSDLYWALSGGGGGTYGVTVSVTVKAHQDGPVGGASLLFTSAGLDQDIFWNGIDAFHASLPAIVDSGSMAIESLNNAFFTIVALTSPNKTTSETNTILQPFLQKLQNLNITYQLNLTHFPTYYEHVDHYFGPLPFGIWPADQLTAGRLIPRSLISENSTILTSVARSISNINNGNFGFSGLALNVNHSIAGNTPSSNAVLPAWREALISVSVQGTWNYTAPLSVEDAMETENTNVVGEMLKEITPGSGTYMNEADFGDPDWKEDFFGVNYERLRGVKGMYDPGSLFYAKTAVGSDEFELDGEGRLCRVS